MMIDTTPGKCGRLALRAVVLTARLLTYSMMYCCVSGARAIRYDQVANVLRCVGHDVELCPLLTTMAAGHAPMMETECDCLSSSYRNY
jgi:hypothetical protein